MNGFSVCTARQGSRHVGRFRLAHWAAHKTVNGDDGEPVLFTTAAEAHVAATAALLAMLNGAPRFWRGSAKAEGKAAAEALFRRIEDGQEKQAGG